MIQPCDIDQLDLLIGEGSVLPRSVPQINSHTAVGRCENRIRHLRGATPMYVVNVSPNVPISLARTINNSSVPGPKVQGMGIRTTVPLFKALLEDADFREGRLDIGMLDRKMADGELAPDQKIEFPEVAIIAAALEHLKSQVRSSSVPVREGGRREGWRRAARQEMLRGNRWS